MAQNDPWFVRAWHAFYDGWNFAQFLAATLFATWASRITGVEWSTPVGPWVALAAALLGGIGSVRLFRIFWTWVRVTTDRPSVIVQIESSGTEKPVLELSHLGAPVTYRAEGRVVRLLDPDSNVRPAQGRFACQLQGAEGRPDGQRVTLSDGDWAHIVLADIDDGRLRIRRGSYSRGSKADDSGVDVEIVIKATPGWPIDEIRRVIRITRPAGGSRIDAVAIDS